ncbi:triphosphoribosyl-dephospho-CoA synthase MdcB [Methylobacterium gnaphalii]|uniref:Probable 2-(5''-triphosphoribosyl)-3'-dephosphocoenzyme-A synthase n=1 Tax=Methylobacterium gnaphalii TaxID=1010610 RepID=A0A512JML6_9HYPH|nr:triphosphoribosyl-dephospho-CoA synthase MdcB [Methylobacterium gnaphalii]GEP11210.1 putative 2-(5''-triphosphoribosyl)-3'-dephosphocoenzyme-A synthase [Methylobacterium gnaphalii]GJD70079.1 2-(5''-triphosphoribosyl)-3'-dephosphocoenzyme-A synthase [Methylobacterium gnaphalii]GLS49715.1 putative 2-(5''-triphosphoribosyl)-3'-dephosphocoenzyme-A synthase [Methylobacterium gnaphalii]
MSTVAAFALQPICDAAVIGRCAVEALWLELETYPKPGLVSLVDSGSHDDMDAATFEASAAALEPFFRAFAEAGNRGTAMDGLRRIGIEAEAAMLAATGGVNTHRGAIFGLGLLASAAGACGGVTPIRSGALGAHVARRHAQGILKGPVLLHAPGARARRRHGVGGAPAEAAAGFPTVYRIGLPALRRGMALRPDDPEAARVEACFALIAATEDTNLLHRGGPDGLAFARRAATEFLAHGGVGQPNWRQAAESIHRDFMARRLSPGGAADLLAMTLFTACQEHAGHTHSLPEGSAGSSPFEIPASC